VTKLLDGCLGALPYRSGGKLPLAGRVVLGPATGLLYALLFCALPWLLFEHPEPHLFWLSVFGSLYAAWATTIARSTSGAVLALITSRIIPALSAETSQNIDSELARRFTQKQLLIVSWAVAILGTVAAAYAITRDAPDAPFIQVAWWSVGWLLLFFTAAKTTNVARFYYVFADRLEHERHFYVLDPARTALVSDIASVGRTILLFWAGISISITMLMPFSSLESYDLLHFDWHSFLSRHTAFELLVLPITSVFSIPFGTYVFLHSESAIRKAVDKAVHATPRSTERQSSGFTW
jgi:hypothetical protein